MRELHATAVMGRSESARDPYTGSKEQIDQEAPTDTTPELTIEPFIGHRLRSMDVGEIERIRDSEPFEKPASVAEVPGVGPTSVPDQIEGPSSRSDGLVAGLEVGDNVSSISGRRGYGLCRTLTGITQCES